MYQHFSPWLNIMCIKLPEDALECIIKAAIFSTITDDADLLVYFLVVGSKFKEICSFYIPLEFEEGVVIFDRVLFLCGDVLLGKSPVGHFETICKVVVSGYSRVKGQVAREAFVMP